MSIFNGPNISTSGLVLDIDQSNTQKSWIGSPTTNLVSNGNFSNGTTGWSNYGLSTVPYVKLIDSIPDSLGTFKTVLRCETLASVHGGGNYGGFSSSAPSLTAGQAYTISFWARSLSGNMTFTFSHQSGSGDNSNFASDFTITSSWVKYTKTTTSLNIQKSTFYFYNASISSGIFEITDIQIENSTLATPFVNGTRANTRAILDLTRRNTLTASSLTYNSDGSYSFNGTSNTGITVPFNSSAFTFNNEQSIIIWMKNSSPSSARRNPYNQAYGGAGTITHENDTNFNYYYGTAGVNNTPYTSHTSPFSVVVGETAQICITRNTSQTAWYKNGVLGNTNANPYGATVTGTNDITIGSGYAGYFGGNIYSVKVYNRAITAQEVSQNFNAYRNRYGL